MLITRQGGPGAPASISIRGSNSNEVLVIVDGQPINSALTGEADLSRIPLADVEQITVVRGAASARYGPGALAGVVLITTRRPSGTELSASATAASFGERNASVSAGFDAPRAASGIVTVTRNATHGDFSYVVPAERGGGTAIRDNDDAVLTSISTAADTHGTIALSAHGSATAGGRGLPGSVSAPDCCAHDGDTRVAGGLSAHEDQSLIAWSVALDADHERTRYVDTEPSIPPPYDDRATTTGVIGTATATIGGPAANIAAGADIRSLAIAATDLTAAAPSVERDDGGWAQGRLSHSLGAGFTGSLDGTLRAEWNSIVHGTVASPHGSASIGRGPLLLSVSGGQSYNPPSLSDQYFREGVLVRPNPDLRPERVRDEIEVRFAVRDVVLGPAHLTGEAAVYRADIDGMILWFPNFQFILEPGQLQRPPLRLGHEHAAHHSQPGALRARDDQRYLGRLRGSRTGRPDRLSAPRHRLNLRWDHPRPRHRQSDDALRRRPPHGRGIGPQLPRAVLDHQRAGRGARRQWPVAARRGDRCR